MKPSINTSTESQHRNQKLPSKVGIYTMVAKETLIHWPLKFAPFPR